MDSPQHQTHHFTPSQVIALGFFLLIILGTLLLMLPFSSRGNQVTPFLDALFTATSATCVTGLVVHDTGTYWSEFGQFIILLLIQVGGLGFITIALLVNMLRGTKIGLRERFIMQEANGLPQMAGILRTTGLIFCCTALFEGAGAIILATQFVPAFGLARGLWYSFFHSISAFCNAGFDLMGIRSEFSSMTTWSRNLTVNVVLMILIVVGGLGFAVWSDVYEQRGRLHQYRLQTKIVLFTTFILLVVPFLFLLLFEFKQPQWDGMSIYSKTMASLFQAVTPRTAGFNTIDYSLFSEPGLVMTIVLMMIGGSPGSTAGGLKTTTVAVIFLSVRSTLRHKEDTEVFGRRLEHGILKRATVLVFIYICLMLFGGCAIAMLDSVPVISAMFEAASAVGTVGLSLGLTPTLSVPSHIILIFLMYFGRVGGLTMIYAFSASNKVSAYRLPQAGVTVG